MSRFAPNQHDLFAPPPSPRSPPRREPTRDEMLEELRALLAKLRAADDLPYATLSDAGSAEARAMGFWSRTGPEGAALGTAITAEFWRLHGL